MRSFKPTNHSESEIVLLLLHGIGITTCGCLDQSSFGLRNVHRNSASFGITSSKKKPTTLPGGPYAQRTTTHNQSKARARVRDLGSYVSPLLLARSLAHSIPVSTVYRWHFCVSHRTKRYTTNKPTPCTRSLSLDSRRIVIDSERPKRQ